MSDLLKIAPYNAAWPDEFEQERRRIIEQFRDTAKRIDHVGSTSVPGLAAKPIIDIQISVSPLHPLDGYTSQLARLGYVHVPHADDAFCPFFHKPADGEHTHHVHLVEAGGDEEKRVLAFRDYLHAYPDTAKEYEQLKRELAPNFSHENMQAYADAKSAFIGATIERALATGFPRREIQHPNGERLIFLKTSADTNGELLEMEGHYAPHSPKPPEHYHSRQREHFTIIRGVYRASIGGEERTYRDGDSFDIEPGVAHWMHNISDEPGVLNWQVRPALRTQHMFETLFGVARDGKVGASGVPNPLQLAIILRAFRTEFTLSKPPLRIQALVFTPLAWIGRMCGYRAMYPEYSA